MTEAEAIILSLRKDIEECMRDTMSIPEYIPMTKEQYEVIRSSLAFVTSVTKGAIPPNTFSGIPIKIVDNPFKGSEEETI